MSPPSLRALRAFAETTRTGSLVGASRALNVSPSAISHLLRELEQSLALTLFITRGPNARPTETGERLGRRLITAFDTIDAAITEARHQGGDIRVSALSSFLTLWLVPRLTDFQSRHPDIRLLLSAAMRPVDLGTEPFECAIRWGHGNWPNLELTLLFRDHTVVVSNPRLTGPRLAGTSPTGCGLSEARPQNLPRLAARTRPDDWPMAAAALGWPDTPPTLSFETRALAVQAAIAGMGAAVVDRNLVVDMLADHLLTEIVTDPKVSIDDDQSSKDSQDQVRKGHWFVALPDRLRIRQVRQFRDWLVDQATRSPKAKPPIPKVMHPTQDTPSPVGWPNLDQANPN